MTDFNFLFDQLLDRRYASPGPVHRVEETDTHYLLSFDVPGVSKKDISIEVKGNQLFVSGERRARGNESGPVRFERAFTLSPDIDVDKIEANHEDGVLTLGLPKAETAKPRQIKIAENGGGSFFERFLKGDQKAAEHAA